MNHHPARRRNFFQSGRSLSHLHHRRHHRSRLQHHPRFHPLRHHPCRCPPRRHLRRRRARRPRHLRRCRRHSLAHARVSNATLNGSGLGMRASEAVAIAVRVHWHHSNRRGCAGQTLARHRLRCALTSLGCMARDWTGCESTSSSFLSSGILCQVGRELLLHGNVCWIIVPAGLTHAAARQMLRCTPPFGRALSLLRCSEVAVKRRSAPIEATRGRAAC